MPCITITITFLTFIIQYFELLSHLYFTSKQDYKSIFYFQSSNSSSQKRFLKANKFTENFLQGILTP